MIEERAQPRVVVGTEAIMGAERVRYLRQRLAEMLFQQVLVGDIIRNLAQPVHVVGEGDQPGLDLVLGEHAEGVAHHGGARHFAEGADVRQARGAVAGFEDDRAFRLFFQPRDDLACFVERPSVGVFRQMAQGFGGFGRGHFRNSGAHT